MALDRTWYDTLVDDDGSGLTGSVWDKADVDALMDAVDSEIARVDGEVTQGLWTPVLNGSGGGTPIYNTSETAGAWVRQGDLFTLQGRITLTSKGSLSGQLYVSGIPHACHGGSYAVLHAGYNLGHVTGIYGISLFLGPGGALATLVMQGGSGTAVMDTTHIGNDFTIIFGGSYRTA